MFQDINPHIYHNEFKDQTPQSNDFVIIYQNGKVLMEETPDGVVIPQHRTALTLYPDPAVPLVYLFSIDDHAFFLSLTPVEAPAGFFYQDISNFRNFTPDWMAFAGATASHLAGWYDSHRYCGKCAAALEHLAAERAVQCPKCGTLEYPKIAPVVIVAVTNGDRLLLTRYATAAYRRYALIAGFVEIGETFEDAVRREVMEEVGLRVKNIRYYKSQPWAFSQSILAGYFVELDGNHTVTLDENELSEASWFQRESLPDGDSTMSLTWSMIEAFRAGFMPHMQ